MLPADVKRRQYHVVNVSLLNSGKCSRQSQFAIREGFHGDILLQSIFCIETDYDDDVAIIKHEANTCRYAVCCNLGAVQGALKVKEKQNY